MEATIDAWPGIAENIGLPGSRIASAVVDTWGWTAHVVLRRGTTAAEAIGKIPAIESGLGLPPGTARVTPDNARADRVVLRIIETNPHANPIPWPGPTTTSITQTAQLGLFEDGSPIKVSLLRRNILIGGTTGAGKSGLVNVIMAVLTACDDVVIWGVDLKGGMELQPWAECLGRPLATTPEEATALFQDAIRELNQRAEELAARGLRILEPSRQNSALLIVVDEYAEMPQEAQEHADSIARRGRAVAVNMLAATQRPTQEAMGHGAVRSQMDTRICLRVKERRDVDLILGQGSFNAGWHAHTITQPGVFLISDPEHTAPERALAYLIDDTQVHRHVGLHAHGRPDLGRDEPGMPPDAPESPESTESATVGEAVVLPPERVLWGALRAASSEGMPITALMAACGMSRSWVYARLQEHSEAGRAVQIARGRWRAAASPDRPEGGRPPSRPDAPGPGRRPHRRGQRGPKSGHDE